MPMKVELVQRDARSAPKAPEHEKLKKVAESSQVCGEFLEWLQGEKSLVLARWSDWQEVRLAPVHPRVQDLLAEFFEIDQEKLEAEKVALLEWVRAGERASSAGDPG